MDLANIIWLLGIIVSFLAGFNWARQTSTSINEEILEHHREHVVKMYTGLLSFAAKETDNQKALEEISECINKLANDNVTVKV